MRKNKPNLKSWSDTSIAHLQAGPTTWRLRDPKKTPGLYLLLYAKTSRKTFQFFVQHQGRQIQIKLGQFPYMNVAEARDSAKEEMAKLERQGIATSSKAMLWTVDEALQTYLQLKGNLSHSAVEGYQRQISLFGWNDRIMSSITNEEIVERAAELRATELAKGNSNRNTNNSLNRLKTLFVFANKRLNKNETKFDVFAVQGAIDDYGGYAEGKKVQFKSHEDWAIAYHMADSHYEKHPVVATHYMLTALTGLRPWEELAGLRWSEVDWENECLRIPGSRMKISGERRAEAGLPDVFVKHLSARGVQILRRWYNDMRQERFRGDQRRGYVFPSRSSKSGLPHFQNNADFRWLVENELGYPTENRSQRRFFITTAKILRIPDDYRLAMTDHSRNVMDIQTTYTMESDPRWERELKSSEQEVATAFEDYLNN